MAAALRTGIFGGTFDPVHNAHLEIARGALEAAHLDRVLLMPVGEPAHRQTHAPAADRAAMVRLALLGGDPRLQFDATALEQPGPVYTADTLAIVHATYPHDTLFFIAGADSLAATVWRRLDEVANLVERFYVVPRRGSTWSDVAGVIGDLKPESKGRFAALELKTVDISASDIRKRIKAGESIAGLVPDLVARYIAQHGLYN
jgi:nicotinate-nucleotide adenylyltransferase